MERTSLAGFPATIEPAGKLLVTTEPAPTTTRSPNSTPFRMMDLAPRKQAAPIFTGREFRTCSVFQLWLSPHTWKSLSMTMHPAPIKLLGPTSMDFPATRIELLIPTESPIRMMEPGAMVLKTQGDAPPKGLARRELSRVTARPKSMEESG